MNLPLKKKETKGWAESILVQNGLSLSDKCKIHIDRKESVIGDFFTLFVPKGRYICLISEPVLLIPYNVIQNQ